MERTAAKKEHVADDSRRKDFETLAAEDALSAAKSNHEHLVPHDVYDLSRIGLV
jgi:hypothetical protein